MSHAIVQTQPEAEWPPLDLASAFDDARRVGVAARTIRLLDAFVEPPAVLGLTQLAERSGLPKSTAHRLLITLVEEGYVRRVGGQYALTNRLFAVGNSVAVCRPNGLRDMAQPHMLDLFASTRETVHLAVLDGAEVLYLESFSATARHGSEPRSAAAAQPSPRPWERRSGPSPNTIHIPPEGSEGQRRVGRGGMPSLHEELHEARGGRGYATDVRGKSAPLRCVAAPVLDVRGGAPSQRCRSVHWVGPIWCVTSPRRSVAQRR